VASVEELTTSMAAAYYAAKLRPDPTLDEHPDQMAEYLATGSRLLTTLIRPSDVAVVHCYRSRPTEHRTRALATVHDHRLVVFQERGRAAWGSRLSRHSVVDLEMAQGEGYRSVATWCPTCGDGHDLNLRWLKRAYRNAESDRTFRVTGAWQPGIPDDQLTPDHYLDERGLPGADSRYRNVAFARVVGTFDCLLLIMAEWFRPIRYIQAFGYAHPIPEHVARLYGGNHIVAQRELWQAVDRCAREGLLGVFADVLPGGVDRP
jgi:hypothetical protein